jgi:septum formation protein
MLDQKLRNYKIILASASPRRKQLLEEMGVNFDVSPKHVDEIIPDGLSPKQVAEYLSKLKADAFSETEIGKKTLVITADTVVALKNEILGKPVNREDAIRILKRLSGNSHKVITGVTLKSTSKQRTFSVTTKVVFKELSDEEINFYIDNFKPYDKAGAYGIQEWIGHVAIEKIKGSYFNVMGLPTHRLHEELINFIG